MPLPCRSGSPPARRSRFDAPPDNAAAAAQQAALAALQQQQLQKQLLAQQQLMQQQARTSPLRFLFRHRCTARVTLHHPHPAATCSRINAQRRGAKNPHTIWTVGVIFCRIQTCM